MTEENYNYRTGQALLRNQFPGKGRLQIPIIPRFEAKPGDFDDLLLIGFDKTHLEDNNHLNRMVHFFLYDYRFERVWKNPNNDIEKLSRYRAVLSARLQYVSGNGSSNADLQCVPQPLVRRILGILRAIQSSLL